VAGLSHPVEIIGLHALAALQDFSISSKCEWVDPVFALAPHLRSLLGAAAGEHQGSGPSVAAATPAAQMPGSVHGQLSFV
jgi:hypothetical protein